MMPPDAMVNPALYQHGDVIGGNLQGTGGVYSQGRR